MVTPRSSTKRRKLPRLTGARGKLLSDKEIEQNINNWAADEIEDELRLTAFLDVNSRRNVRLATGIGDMNTFVEEFNNAFANSSQLSPQEKSKKGQEAFGEPWKNRPKLKKINQEYQIKYQPKVKR